MPQLESTDARPAAADFIRRHIGPGPRQIEAMLETVGCESLDALIEQVIPSDILRREPLEIPHGRDEYDALEALRAMAAKNTVYRSFLGTGYYPTITPTVILRNVLENPGWYTQYTPYQAEISQGRLEALLNFQTMVADLTALPLANASLLDEATAAAEAMGMAWAVDRHRRSRFLVADDCHPQTIAVVETRAQALGIDVVIADAVSADLDDETFGVLVQYPTTHGRVIDYRALASRAHDAKAMVVAAADLLSLTLLTPPGEWGADIAVGTTQRFGVPMGYGGPHAAYLSTREEFKRNIPGRIIGVSKDVHGDPAYRMALQTREQHIRRDKATSNICTAQALLAIMASMYAVYHGPKGLQAIAQRIFDKTQALAGGLRELGYDLAADSWFDTLHIQPMDLAPEQIEARARTHAFNLRHFDDGSFGVSLDETTTLEEVRTLLAIFTPAGKTAPTPILKSEPIPAELRRMSEYLTHAVFSTHHSEHEMLRYLHRLQARDLSLTTSMIPLGSCTMKLNGTTEMVPVTWGEFANIHPFAPAEQAAGYRQMFDDLEAWLAEITGFAAVSLQPNAGAQGEYAGLRAIRAYHESRGDRREACLIPVSAHGTNPASAVMAGMRVVAVACDDQGNIDIDDLRAKAEAQADDLGALMITYPSTHGVFESHVQEVCNIVHEHGGQVYMDGANMNAQVGLCRPGDMGADVCHLNLHKTFCIPHGGGGPGMGPIGVAKHLAPFLPGHPMLDASGGAKPGSVGPVAAAPYGSPLVLPISWAYIALMGGEGLTQATQIAILNANYMARRLKDSYKVLYTGAHGRVAHEFVLDTRPYKQSAGIDVTDIAKRLMDYGFHAPTMSWPVPGTLMIEPTESESKRELDRFCDAMISIREEIRAVEEGRANREDNVLVNAPHTAARVTADTWTHEYSRQQAAYPAPWLKEHKFWPAVGRVDNAYGDRHLICTCPSVEDFA